MQTKFRASIFPKSTSGFGAENRLAREKLQIESRYLAKFLTAVYPSFPIADTAQCGGPGRLGVADDSTRDGYISSRATFRRYALHGTAP